MGGVAGDGQGEETIDGDAASAIGRGASAGDPDPRRLRGLAFDATTTGILVTDPRLPDNPIVEANPAFERLTGYARAEVLGRNCRFLQGPQTDPDAIARIRAAVASGDEISETLRNYRKDGSPFWNDLCITPVRDETGQLTHFVGVQTDASARMEAEQALAAERDLLQAVLAQLPDAVYVKDAARRFVRLNQPAARSIGAPDAAGAFGKTDADFFPPDLAREFAADERRVMDTGEPMLDKPERQGDGDEARWVLASKVPWRDPAGEVVGIIGVNRDVTERLRTEAALRASEARFRAALDGSLDAFALLQAVRDDAGRIEDFAIVELNERAAEMMGRPREAAVGQRVSDLLRLAGTSHLFATYARVAETGEAIEEEIAVGGTAIRAEWLRHQVVKVGDGLAITTRDITGRKRTEAELVAAKEAAEESSRLRGAFLSTMSHELRTPLTAIVGFADLLRGILDGSGMPQEAEDAAQILRSSQHLLRLIDEVLSFSRLGSGKVVLQRETIDAGELARTVADEMEPLAAAKGLRLTVDAPAVATVGADPVRLRQVLLNLVGNAVKFTERGGIAITVGGVGDAVEIAVADTGIGIAAAALPHVFDEFRQADDSTTRRYGGTGLGLAIAKKLVELHGGTIRAESEPGVGSTFTVVLPAGDDPS